MDPKPQVTAVPGAAPVASTHPRPDICDRTFGRPETSGFWEDDLTRWRFCVAPMMAATDRHCRYLHRRLSRRARLYTEMLHAEAVLRGHRARLLDFDPAERPLALQLGGADPKTLARAARIGEAFGYDEINLNCGCPSSRVQEGRFGACLMLEPARVAECVAAMRAAVRVPVTVKCRIGVDHQDEAGALLDFVDPVAAAGCETFIVHARKAWLAGLSPKENREVPPLRYERVAQLKRLRPALTVVLNGGLDSLAAAERALQTFDGVMLGRAAYDNPWLLTEVDARLFGDSPASGDRAARLRDLRGYVEAQRAAGVPLATIVRAWLGLYRGQPGGRAFRRVLSERAHRPGAGFEAVEAALAAVAATNRLAA